MSAILEKMEFEKLKEIVAPIFSRNKVLWALLFGSSARGSVTKHSDLDILIVQNSDKRFFDRFDPFNELYDRLPNRAIDLLIYTPAELEQIRHRPFIRDLLKEGKTIYEQGEEPAGSGPVV
ncbi:MAG: nucleotidyltransferase domain-containing protein [Deltaproteobacteria bacterium]|nr:nucleotidyltransferase domain-containing protein [Deltaproteobacteria bacterium]